MTNMRRLLKKPTLCLRDGGDLRTGHGGVVPGSGSGDKIPAKYEPGEFVVSNDMLDASPGLREGLHSLRGDVLAAKGSTPAQADAKAVSGGGLRAASGFDGAPQLPAPTPPVGPGPLVQGADGVYAPLSGARGLRTTADTGRAFTPPVGGSVDPNTIYQGTNTGRATGVAATGSGRGVALTGDAGRAIPYMAPPPNPSFSGGSATSPQAAAYQASRTGPFQTAEAAPAAAAARSGSVFGTAGEWRDAVSGAKSAASESLRNTGRLVAPTGTAGRVFGGIGKALKPLAAPLAAVDLGTSLYDGRKGDAAWAAGDLAASGALFTPAAPAAAAYLGARGTYEGAKAASGLINDNLSDSTKDVIGGTINQGLRSFGKTLGQNWGTNDDAYLSQQGAGAGAGAGTTAAQPRAPANQTTASSLRLGAPLDNSGRGAGYADPRRLDNDTNRDYTNELNKVPAVLPAGLRDGQVYKTVGKDGRVTYSGRNVGQQADGSTRMVDGAGNALAMRGSLDVSSGPVSLGGGGFATTPGGPGTAAASQARTDQALTNPDGSRWTANDNAVMAANLRDGRDAYVGTSRGAGGAGGAGDDSSLNQLRQLAMSPPGTAGRVSAMRNLIAMEGNQVARRGQDVAERSNAQNNATSLRNNALNNATSLRNNKMNNDFNFGKFKVEQGNWEKTNALAEEAAVQARGDTARKGLGDELKVYGADGKQDEGASLAAVSQVQKLFPGIDLLSPQGRSANLPEAKILAKVFGRAYQGKQMGIDKINPFERRAPEMDSMPNWQGGTLKRQGLSGALTPGSQSGGYYISRKDGTDVPLGADLSERELEVIKHHLATGQWRNTDNAQQGK